MSHLDVLMHNLAKELEIPEGDVKTTISGVYKIPLDPNFNVTVSSADQVILIQCPVAPYPKNHQREEAFLTEIMVANLLGQGTHGSVLGLTPNGDALTLTREIPNFVEYKFFINILEDFFNVADFWHSKALEMNAVSAQ